MPLYKVSLSESFQLISIIRLFHLTRELVRSEERFSDPQRPEPIQPCRGTVTTTAGAMTLATATTKAP